MPIATPTKLSDDTWGVWLDTEAQEVYLSLPHPFCEVETKSGRTWIVKVYLPDVDTKFHTGAKYPSESIKDDELESWLELHRETYEKKIPRQLDRGDLSESESTRLYEDLQAYRVAKADYDKEHEDLSGSALSGEGLSQTSVEGSARRGASFSTSPTNRDSPWARLPKD